MSYVAYAVVGSILMLSGAAVAQDCGNGVIDNGEQCDFAMTDSGFDECDGCAVDCTVTEECGFGLCQDGIDNDGDLLIDSEDPECATLTMLRTLAAVASEDRRSAMHLGPFARIGASSGVLPGNPAPFPFGDSDADVCGPRLRVQDGVIVEGSVASPGGMVFHHRTPAGIGGELVLAGADKLFLTRAAPLVGSPQGVCSVSGQPCLAAPDCPDPRREACIGRLGADDPLNAAVDLDGAGSGAAVLARCLDGIAALSGLAEDLDSLDPNDVASGGVLRVPFKSSDTVFLEPGFNYLRYSSVSLAYASELTLDGPADAVVVIDIDRTFKAGGQSTIRLAGGIEPGRVLWRVRGRRPPDVKFGSGASLEGVIFAPERVVKLTRGVQVRGALYAKRIKLSRGASIEHQPFLGQLPPDLAVQLSGSSEAVEPGSALRLESVVANNGFAPATATVTTLTLDPQVTLVAAVPSQGTCAHDGSPAGGEVVCSFGGIAPAAQVIVAVDVAVTPAANGAITMSGSASSSVDEIHGGDNAATVLLPVVSGP